MNKIIIETSLSKEALVNRIEEITGNKRIDMTAPFSGWVKGDQFRINKTSFIVHPFLPVVKGRVRSIKNGSIIELEFVHPWIGHVSFLTALAVYFGLPISGSWWIILVIFFLWCTLFFKNVHDKDKLIDSIKSHLYRGNN